MLIACIYDNMLTGFCKVDNCFTTPEPSCCRMPVLEFCEHVLCLLDRMLFILELSKYGTLLLVFGMLPPLKIVKSHSFKYLLDVLTHIHYAYTHEHTDLVRCTEHYSYSVKK